MTHSRPYYPEPYRDPYGVGFDLSIERSNSRPPCPQRAIVAVMVSVVEEDARFVNAARLAVPAKFNLDTLAPLLRRHSVRQEFGRVLGEGQFAFKPAELRALESSGRIKSWVVHWLPEPAGYLDDADTWAAYVEADQVEERKAFANNHDAVAELRQRRADVTPWYADRAAYDAALLKQLEERRAELDAWRRDELAKSAQIAAWLRGTAGDPPLLALMKGAA